MAILLLIFIGDHCIGTPRLACCFLEQTSFYMFTLGRRSSGSVSSSRSLSGYN